MTRAEDWAGWDACQHLADDGQLGRERKGQRTTRDTRRCLRTTRPKGKAHHHSGSTSRSVGALQGRYTPMRYTCEGRKWEANKWLGWVMGNVLNSDVCLLLFRMCWCSSAVGAIWGGKSRQKRQVAKMNGCRVYLISHILVAGGGKGTSMSGRRRSASTGEVCVGSANLHVASLGVPVPIPRSRGL